MRNLVGVVLVSLVLAGCSGSSPDPQESVSLPTETPAPEPTYDVTFLIVAEHDAGQAIKDASVKMFPASATPMDGHYERIPSKFTNAEGLVRFSFPGTQELHVLVQGPGKDWSPVGFSIIVDKEVSPPADFTVDGRTVVVPLLHPRLAFSVQASWENAVATINPDGTTAPAAAGWPLTLTGNAAAAAAYLSHLASGSLTLTWTNGETGVGDLYAGMGWTAEAPSVIGADELDGPTGRQEETWSGSFPEGRPGATAARLYVTVLTDSALAGKASLSFTGTLAFVPSLQAGIPEPIVCATFQGTWMPGVGPC